MKRRGKFKIKRTWFDDFTVDFLNSVFAGCIIVKAEMDFMSDCLLYYAYHPHFQEVPEGFEVPEYEAIYNMQMSGLGTDEKPDYIPVFQRWELVSC